MSCPRCGMYVPHCRLDNDFNPIPGPVRHECPEPYDEDTAWYLLRFYVDTGIPAHPRTKARIKLALDP